MARRKKAKFKSKVSEYGSAKRAKRPPAGTKAIEVANAETIVEGTSAKFIRGKRKHRRHAGEHGGVEGTPIPGLGKIKTLMDSGEHGFERITGTRSGSVKEYFNEVFGGTLLG